MSDPMTIPVEKPISKILAPVDFSEASEAALRQALHLAHRSGAELTILNVADALPCPPGYPAQQYLTDQQTLVSEIRAKIAALVARLWPTHFAGTCKTQVTEGVPPDEIVAAAQNVDLIVIATHGLSGFKRFVLGSTVDKVIRYAPCSVLVVKDKQAR